MKKIIHIYIIEKQDKDNVKKGNKQALFKRIFPSALLHDKKSMPPNRKHALKKVRKR